MDSSTARWMMVVYLTQDQLEELHQREISLAKLSKDSGRYLGWEDRTFLTNSLRLNGLDPYWPTEMGGGDQAIAVGAFERAIYPMWNGVKKKWMENTAPYSGLTELEMEHAIDWKLWKSTVKPNRAAVTADSAEQARRKSSAVKKMGEVFS